MVRTDGEIIRLHLHVVLMAYHRNTSHTLANLPQCA